MKVKAKILSHTELNITFAELGALLGTRAMLKHKVLVHEPERFPDDDKHIFNMDVSCRTEDCGSVACIGGTMAMIMGRDDWNARQYVSHANGALRRLFFPMEGVLNNFSKITPKQSIQAIDNFLTTGEPNWQAILELGA